VIFINKEYNMKKTIKLTESDLTRIVKRVVMETKLQNSSEVDKVLDKMNKYGKDSLTWLEKQILDNPDDTDNDFEGDDNVHELISILLKNDLVDPNLINAMEDHIEVYGMKGCESDYFRDNYITLYPESIDEGIIVFDGEHYGEEIDYKEFDEVYYFVEEHWEPLLGLEFH
jgi:hypothetical protein